MQTTAANVLAANAGLPVVCIENAGGVRTDIPAGNVTLGQVVTVLPFGSTYGQLSYTLQGCESMSRSNSRLAMIHAHGLLVQ